MSLQQFELFHGAVLTKLVRSDRPLTLTMIATRPRDAWSTYRVNDVNILVKQSLSPRLVKTENAIAWQFIFTPEQTRQLKERGTWAALVCGSRKIGDQMEVCLLDPQEVKTLLNLSSRSQQSLLVKYMENKSLRASSSRVQGDLIIARNRVDKWDAREA